ncbi:MAG: tyrosine--tRNA ligase [Bacteroidia bacterium]
MGFTPNYNLVEELKWRGLYHQDMPGTEELLQKEMVKGYIGFDPTADSLHIGNMVPIILLVHLQRSGHKPIALVGGATGMVGDPSGKKAERQLLDLETINHNLKCQTEQLKKFLSFKGDNAAEVVNNYDWFKDYGFLDFIREIGKHISINYMMAKDSVKNRLEEGMSFTEFSYQLVQGYDFFHLWKEQQVKLQMGGSDQWGNIVTGTELIRRKGQGEGFALTAPLITKADGSKFGKSEGGNVWLDANRTSPYEFYQFWINVSDEDAERYIKIFTLHKESEIENLISEHKEAPHLRVLQKELAKYMTTWVHGEEAFNKVFEMSDYLFRPDSIEKLSSLNDQDLLSIFSGKPQAKIAIVEGMSMIDVLSAQTQFLPSNKEAGRALKENSVSINGEKVTADRSLSEQDLINGKFVIVQRGKRKHFLIIKE